MNDTRAKLTSEIGNLDVDSVTKLEDRYAAFPYITTVTWYNAVVYEHAVLAKEVTVAYEDYIEPADIEEIFVITSVAAAVIRKKLENVGRDDLSAIYMKLASPDNLCTAVFNSMEQGDTPDVKSRFLLSAITSGTLTPDIAGVNGTRLAVNLATANSNLRKPLQNGAREHLLNTIDWNNERYELALNAMGRNSPLQQNKLLASSLSTAFVALAYPMDDSEANQYFDMLYV